MLSITTDKINITPTSNFDPVYLSGHAIRTSQALGVLNDIYVETLLLRVKSQKILFIAIELIGLDKHVTDDMVKIISDRFGLKKENIIITFTHTHSAPEYASNHFFAGDRESNADKYMKWVTTKVYDSVSKCFEKEMIDVTVSYKKTYIIGAYGNRNGIDKDGDKLMTLIKFSDYEGNNVSSICSFACHPTVLGPENLKVSPDIAGYLSRYIESQLGGTCLVMLGAAGNMSNRHYRQGNDQSELERVGLEITDQLNLKDSWAELSVDNLTVDRLIINKEYKADLEFLKEQLKDVENRLNNADSFDIKKVYTSAKAGLSHYINNFEENYSLILDCRYIKLGDISIFTMPGEPFSVFGTKVREAMKNKCNIFLGYTYYNGGYLYNTDEYGESFESIVSKIPNGESEKIFDEIIDFVS